MKKGFAVQLLVLLSFASPLRLMANPVGGAVQAGSATITHQGPGWLTVNQSSDKAIIDWHSFSIGAGEVTRFIQPSANSAALNRVLGGNPTEIYGLLQANGQVFVLNPAGILVGRSGVINTHSFAGSTLDVTDSSFLSGVGLRFSGTSTAAVRNQGTIQALGGDIFLFAHQVENAGSLTAASGTVGLAAGSEIVLSQTGTEHVSVLAGNVKAGVTAKGVDNAGAIQAATAELKAAGGNIYALAINNGGIVRATTVVSEGGHVYLRAAGGNIQNSGTLSASAGKGNGGSVVVDGGHDATAPSTVINSGTIEARGESSASKGGTVEMLGDHVGLFDHALVDVSGQVGGGSAWIGGGFHGANPGLQNAQSTYVGPDAQINADALSRGNGGNIAVWSDIITRFYGSISDRGGNLDGNGGFVETSGKNLLDVFGASVNGAARHGAAGHWLLDPTIIDVVSGDPHGANDPYTANLTDVSTFAAPDIGVGVTAIEVNSIENSTSLVTLQAKTDINFNTAVTMTHNGVGITAQAGNSIFVNNGITTLGGTVTLSANDPAAPAATGTGAVTIKAPISTAGGGIDIKGPAIVAPTTSVTLDSGGGNITFEGSLNGAKALTLNAHAGNISLKSVGGTTPLSGLAASGTTVTLNGDVKTDGGDVDFSGAGAVVLSAATVTIDTDSAAANAGNVLFGNATKVDGDGVSGRSLVIDTTSAGTAGSINLGVIGSVTRLAGLTASGGTLTLNGNISTEDGPVNLSGIGAVAVAQNVAIDTDGSQNGGAAGAITFGATTTINATAPGHTLSLDASGQGSDGSGAINLGIVGNAAPLLGGLTLNGATLTLSGAVKIDPAGTIDLASVGNIPINANITAGSLQVHSGTDGSGDISFGPGVTVQADTQAYQAGDGTAGAATSAQADLLGNSPVFKNTAGSAAPGTFTYRQDAAIASTAVPAIAPGLAYTIQSDDGSVALPGLTLPGNLQVTANGPITEAGPLTVNGVGKTATFNAAGNNINLSDPNNDFTTAAFTGVDVNVMDKNALTLGASTINGNFTVSANGLLNDSGNLTVVGTTSLAAGAANNISLVAADNFGGAVSIASGKDVTLVDVNAINLGASTISGKLDVTAGGNITQSGLLAVTDTSKFTVTVAGSDISLGDFANLFSGGVTLAVSGAGTIHDVSLHDASATPSLAGLPGTLHNLTLRYDNAGITLPAETLSGNLDVAANGPIADSGNVVVSGTTKLAAGAANNVTLDNADDFGGAVTTVSGKDVTLVDLNAINLAASTISGKLDVTAGGNISQSGLLNVADTSKFTVTAASSDILLGGFANLFNGGVTLAVSGAGSIHDVALHDASATPSLVGLPGTLHNLTLHYDNAGIALPAETLTGNLDVTANGPITDSGNVVVSGTTTLAAGAANNITLDNADNFAGTVTAVSGKDVTLVDINAIDLGGSAISGKLDVTAGGTISQSGQLSVADTSKFTVTAAGSDILLGGFANLFNGGVTLAVSGGGTLRDVALHDASATPSLAGLPATLRNLTLHYDNAGIALPAETLTGNLDLNANGPITDSGSVVVNGTTTLSAGAANNITLVNADDFVGAVSVVSGKDVTLVDLNAINLGASTISGKLDVTAGGSVSESGLLNVSGPSRFTVTAANGDVLLGAFGNLFNGGVSLGVSGAGTIHDVLLRDASATPSLAGLPAALNNLTLRYDNAGIAVPAVSVAGNLDVTANGPITDSGNVTVAGNTTLTAGAANNITFDNVDDFGGAVSIISGRDVTLTDINALTLGASTISGNLVLTANGPISDNANVTVGGATSLSAGGGNNISFTQADDFGGPVSVLSGKDVTLVDVNAINLGGSTIAGQLNVIAGGSISESGPLNVALASKFIVTAAGSDVLLGGFPNVFNGGVTLAVLGPGTIHDVALRDGAPAPSLFGLPATLNNLTLRYDNAGIALPAETLTGNLDVTANGPITDIGTVLVNGTTTLAAGAGNNITLIQPDDFGGGVSVLSGKDVTLVDVNAINLGASTVSGKLDVTAGGSIGESGPLNVTGPSRFTVTAANSDLALGGFANLFNGGVTLAAVGAGTIQNVSLRDASAAPSLAGLPATLNNLALRYDNAGIALPTETLTGNLDVRANGFITQTGPLTVNGAGKTATFDASGNSINLSDANNDFATVFFAGLDVSIADKNALTLGASTINGNLTVAVNGFLNDAGNVRVAGATTLAAGPANGITLSQADDFGGGVSVLSGKDVTLVDVNAISLGASTISGKLDVTAGGNISQSGPLSVIDTSKFTVTAANSDVLLAGSANLFNGGVTLAVSGAGTIHDVALRDASATPSLIGLPATLNNLTLRYDNAGIALPAETLTGNLDVTANGPITDNGNIVVSGTTTLAAGPANAITLDNADDFAGVVSVLSGKDVTLVDVNAINLGASTISGKLDVTAGGSVSQSGLLTVTDSSQFTITGAGSDLLLGGFPNLFNGGVTLAVAGPGTIHDVLLRDASATPSLIGLPATLNNLTLHYDNAGIALPAETLTGNLDVTANGPITDNGAVTVAGSTSLAAGTANNITLDNADDFVGAVGVLSGKDVSLNDINALTVGGTVSGRFAPTAGGPLTLNTLNVAGDLNATAGGLISDAGAVTVNGATTLAAGAANNITLGLADDFVGPVSIISGKDVSLNDINTLAVGGTVSGKLTTTSGGALTLNALNVAGDLSSTAGGLIIDAGAVTVGGATSLAAGAANNITLSQADDFVGPVSIISGKDVTLNDINALILGDSTVSGNLTLTANGLVSDSGNVTVAGATSLAAGAGNDITLDNADSFVGAVSILSGKDVTLNNITALTLGASTVSGNLTVTANGPITDSGNVTVSGATSLTAGAGNNITLDNADDFVGAVSIVSGNDVTLNDINALTLGASSVSGNLSVTANGSISDSGNVTVAGTTSLAAGAANDITLDNANDFVGAVTVASGKDVTLNDINTVTLDASTVSGNLTVSANGLISDIGNLSVAGSASFAAGAANNIILDNANDFGGPVSIASGRDVTLNDINALTLGASTVSGNLTVTANGPISDSGNVTVAGTTSLAAGAANSITLVNADDFVGAVSVVSGKDVTLNDINALTLGASSVSGNLTVTANGLVSDSGNLTVAGTTSLAAGAANNITLDNADDFVGAVSVVSGKDVTLNDINALTLGASTVSGNLAITANGLVSDSGNVVVAGTTSLAAGAVNNITLDNADDFVGAVSVVSGKDVTLNDINALTLGASSISGNLTLTANGLVSDSGNVVVAGTTSLAAGAANNITLDNADDFAGAVSVVSGKDVTLNDVNALTLGASTVTGNLTVTANGVISDSGNVTVAGATSLAAGAANNITFSHADDFVGAVSVVSGRDVELNDINALTLGASTISGNLTVTANGLVSDSGNVVVAGTTSLAAGAANNITLDNADDFVGAVSVVSGKDVTLNDVNALTLGASTVSGNLTVNANGLVSDSGNVVVAGTTSLAAGAANNITLDNADDFVGAVSVVSGKDVTLNDVNALTLGASTVSGNLTVNANGLVSDSGAVTVVGTTSLAAGAANNITLDNADDFVGAVSIVSGKDVTLNDINALALGASTVSGNLTVTANGLVSDSGNVTVAGTTSLAAGAANNITLDNADDFVGAVSVVSGKDVTLNDINALTLGASTVSGNLTVTANGLVSDSGAVTVAGTTTLAAGAANNITLDNADDFVGAVSVVSGKDVTLNDVNALALGASTVSGNLTVTANGPVSDSGAVTVAGTTSLAAGAANSITLDNADDFVGAVSVVSGKDVTLNDINALTLGASSVSGNLKITANGLVSDSGNVTVAGTTSLAAGAANSITLDNADDFVGAVSVVSGKDVTLNDINALTLGASSVSGNLKITANGLVSDSGNVTVAGTTSLAAGAANSITLDNADDFVGAVSVVSGKDVTLNDINALTLGASSVSGNLKITANGLVSDSGNVTVAGTTSLAAGAANSITLDNADDFVGAVSVVSGKDVTLNDVNALTLGASTVSGNLAVTANGLVSDSGNLTVAGTTSLAAGAANNITLDNADDFVGAVSVVSGKDVSLNDVNALTLGASTVSGNLTVTANGLVSDSGNVVVAGTTSLAAGAANNITLDNADDFAGAVSVVSGKDVTLNDINALTLGASSVSGNLVVTANGVISDSGDVTVAGTTSLAAGAANNITLDNADDFVGAVSVVSGKDVTLNDINALTLGSSTVSGNLAITANGLVSDSGNVVVAGTTSLAAGAVNNITLDNADDFVGAVSVVSGKDVTLNDINALTLGASAVSGNLSVTANGLVSDSGNVVVAGTTSLAAGAANNITLDNADDFVGAVSVVSGKDVTLNDVNALTLGASTVAGNLTVTANGVISDSGNVTVAGATSLAAGAANSITFSHADDFVGAVSVVSGKDVELNDINALTLGASTISGNLTVTANGLVSDSGNVVVAGTTSLAAGAANNITLDNADDFVGAVSVVSGKDVTLNDVNALTLGASTVSGNLTVNANGLVSDSGAVTVVGTTSLAAGAANNITLDNADDFVGAVSIVSGKDVTLNDINALALGASTVSGNLTVTANGLVSDSGNVTVAGTTSLAAGAANNITLDNADDFVGAVSVVSGKDVTLNDINALTLGASTVSGNLTVTANGLVSDSGAVTVAGTTSLAAGAANNITLDNADDFVGAVSVVSGKDVTLNDINALTLGASTVSGNLTVTANGLVSDSGAVTVAGTTTLAAGAANNITLDNADDFVGAVSIVSGKDVTLNDVNALTLGASTVSGNLTVTANGPVSDSGAVTVAGTTSLAAGAANSITLDNADDFVGAVSVVSAKDVTLNDINALTLGASSVSGNLKITANGLVSDSGNVTVAGTTSLAAGAANSITLDNADDFVGAVSVVSGKDVTLNDINALTLGASSVSGNLKITANGLVSDSGNVTVAGTTSLAVGAANSITLDNADDFVGAVSVVSGKDVTLDDINALTLGASTVSGNLTVTANGLVSDSGVVTVAGTTSLAAGAANNITLDNADDFVGAVSVVSGKDVTLNDVNALTLGASTISGNLAVTANGLVSDSGNLTVAGTTSLAAGAANNITLDNADDFVGAVSVVSGKDVSLNDVNALTLGASTVSGNLTVTANGLVSDSGNVVVAGTTSLAAGAANNITLDNADDFAGAVSVVSGKDVTLNDINALTLGASSVSGNLVVTANGVISDSGDVTVAGTTSLAAGAANNITLDNADDFVGAVSVVSGKDVTLNDINALTLGSSTVSGNLAITANGLVSDSGNVVVAGTTSLAAGAVNNITLDNADDFVGAVSVISGKDVTLNDINALTLGASAVSGNLSVTANGLVSDSGNVTVAGTTSLAAGAANNITLDNADDFVGAVSVVSGKDVTLNDVNALTLGASTVAGNLTLTANGVISDSGNVTVAGATSLSAGAANNIAFSHADDFVGSVSILSGNDVALNDINALTLGASAVSGNLTVTANGLISDSGNITVAGSTTLAAGAANNITLSQADDFLGPVSIISGKDVTLNDINSLILGASSVSGNLAIKASGPISDNGNVTVAGSTSLAAGAGNNITFNHADDFGGAVSIVSGKDVTLNDINALTLAASTVSGNLTLTANGLISDSGSVTVAGATSLSAGAGNNITLNQADDFVGPVSIVSGKDVTLNDVNALTLGLSSVSGNLVLTADGPISDSGNITVAGGTSLAAGSGNNITFSQADDFIGPVSIVSGRDVGLNDVNALTLGASTVSGNLTLTANGLISDSGDVTVAGGTSLAAGAGNNIAFSHADDFIGPVSIVSGKDVGLNDVNALTLGASTVSGNLTVTANGLISDGGAVTVSGATSLAAGSGNNITLNQADDFVGPVSIVSGKDVVLNDVNALTLGASAVSGNLTISANGLISDSGDVTVAGATSLAAGAANDITLNHLDDFVGPVSVVSGKDVGLNDINALILGPSTVSGNLTITANGLVNDSGALTVAGGTSLAAGTGNNIVLSQADDFGGPVSIVSGKDVTLNDINALTLGASTVSGNLSVTANGLISDSGNLTVVGTSSLDAGAANNITLSHSDDFVGAVSIVSGNDVILNDVNSLTLGASTVLGNLSVTASGLISDSGNLIVAGSTSLAAGAANNITFSHADDFVGPVSIVSGQDVVLNDINALTLGASSVSGNLNVSAGGPITQSAAIIANGSGKTAIFNAPANSITLDAANNDFATARFNGADVVVNDVNALDVGASTVTGNFSVTSGGAITQSGTIVAKAPGTTASFNAAGNLITLADANNDFATVKFNGTDVSLNDANALDLGASTATGNLIVTAGGAISQSGPVLANAAGKTASFSTPGNSITLNNPNNDFATAQFIGGDVVVDDLNSLDLGESHVTGNLTVTANGRITQSGVITASTAGKLASFTAGAANDVSLGLGNDFASVSVPSAHNVTLMDVNGFTLSAVGAAGILDLNTGAGDITQVLDGTAIKAQALSGVVNGALILGNPANAALNPAQQFVSAQQPPNEIGSISSLVHNGDLYVFNSRSVNYGSLLNPGEIANPVLLKDPTAVLGLKITGPVTGRGLTIIRTVGDLVLLGNGRVTTTTGDIELSAEAAGTASGNFHNMAGTVASDGTVVPDLIHGAVAVQAGTDALIHKLGAVPSRFLIFSSDAKQNFGETFTGGRVTFNGLGADFIADQIIFGDHRSPIVKQNAQADNGFGNGFVFVQKQAILQTDESAKFFFDLLTVAIVQAVDATAEVDKLPPERPPTIWTSSYHLYLEEQKKKKKNKPVAEHQAPVLAAELAGK